MAEWSLQSISIAVGVFLTVIVIVLGILTSVLNTNGVTIDNDIDNLSIFESYSSDYSSLIGDIENTSGSVTVSTTDDATVKEGKSGLDSAYEIRTTFKYIMSDIPKIFSFIPKPLFDLMKWIVITFIAMLGIIMLWRYDGGVLR